jgi:hypothetical protein
MDRLLLFAIFAPSVFEFCICLYAAILTQAFLPVWFFLCLFIAAKLVFKYFYLLPKRVHEKVD